MAFQYVHSLSSLSKKERQNRDLSLDLSKIPRHVGIIMDGNRRWALHHKCEAAVGYSQGASRVTPIVREAISIGVEVLTLYAFSTENWHRPQWEIACIMTLLNSYLKSKKDELIGGGVRLYAIGDLEALPGAVRKELESVRKATEKGKNLDLVLAINYGGRDEICRGVKKLAAAAERGEVNWDEVTEKDISKCLDTASWPDPDLIIRTGGEQRMSNFLTWQVVYSEFFVSQEMWPDFSEQHFLAAIVEYQRRRRSFGE